jgi:hypothetical protein
MFDYGLVTPVLALISWSLVIWVWMYATRLPAMQKARINPQDAARPGTLAGRLPASVTNVADNYNHLMEQPTLFYALCLALTAAGLQDGVLVALAWGYVGGRVVHSLVQATINRVTLRFAAFTVTSLILVAMVTLGWVKILTAPAGL